MSAAAPPAVAHVLEEAASRFSVESGTSFRADGAVRAVPSEGALLAALADAVYLRCHLRLLEEPASLGPDLRGREHPVFVDRLRRASAGGSYPEPGWLVVEAREDRVVVRRDGLSLVAAPHELSGGPIREGALLRLHLPAERRYAVAGFYLTTGRAGPPAEGAPLRRLYVNPTSKAAPWALGAITRRLNQSHLRFQCKALNDPAQYARPDGIVLYVGVDDLDQARELVLASLDPRWLKRETPGFAGRLAEGIAWAAEPPPGPGGPVSLGQHRARLVAQGLLAARGAGEDGAGARLGAICAALRSDGVDPAEPHAEAGA